MTKKTLLKLGNYLMYLILISSVLSFSTYLMFHTFYYTPENHVIMVAPKLWSDFGSHIPLIRSFSLGDNFDRMLRGLAPEYPLFPGEPMRYHFLFYALVGLLEKIGLRIDWALNIPSIFGFFMLLFGILLLGKMLFKSIWTGILAVIFFLFNGSMSYLIFFNKHPLNPNTLKDITSVIEFPAFAPWGPGDITAFWNLNIYTNQRHLALAYAILIFYMLTCAGIEYWHKSSKITPKTQIILGALWGFIIGLLPFLHQPTLLMIAAIITIYFLILPKSRLFIFTSGFTALILVAPQLFLLRGGTSYLSYYPGYLIHNELNLTRFVTYWFNNLGLHLIYIPVGYIIAPKFAKKILFPAFILFTVGNLFQFSKEIAANHKFFNMFLILGNLLSAYLIISFISNIKELKFLPLKILLFICSVLVVFFMTFSGVIDLFAIINDTSGGLTDVGGNNTITWIARNTPPSSVFLNSSFFNHPASLAGRKVFLGWPYFAWSAGYDTTTRLNRDVAFMYKPDSLKNLCTKLKKFNISFVTFEKDHMTEVEFDESLYEANFPQVYKNTDNSFRIYDTRDRCP